jgi:hypothetical protein
VRSPDAPTLARQTQATAASPIIKPCVQFPAGRKTSEARQVNGQQIGSKRNSIATSSRKRIASLIRTQVEIDRARPQNSTTAESRKEARVIEPQFTYIFFNPKGSPVPAITREDEPSAPTALSTPKRRSRRINESASPRPAGISAAALHHFMCSAFLDEMKRTIEVNDTPLDQQEVASGVFHPVIKERNHQVQEIN